MKVEQRHPSDFESLQPDKDQFESGQSDTDSNEAQTSDTFRSPVFQSSRSFPDPSEGQFVQC